MSAIVTVAMPLYNGMPHLQRSLALIREQTYRDLDIILCDDASTDATPDVCTAAAREDDRIRFFRHEKNLGMNKNFNFAMRQKRGEYFMWAGQDDEKLPRFVEATAGSLLRNPNAALACTTTVLITSEGERTHKPYSDAISSAHLPERLAAFVAETQTVAIYGLFRSAVIDAIGPMQDWLDTDRHYLFNAAIRGPFEVVDEPLFRYNLIHSAADYVRMGMKMRPGATDFDLDLHRNLPQLLREAGIERTMIDEAVAAMRVPLTPYFKLRGEYLIGLVLDDAKTSRGGKLRLLFAWARQYPPMLRWRMFWGAVREISVR